MTAAILSEVRLPWQRKDIWNLLNIIRFYWSICEQLKINKDTFIEQKTLDLKLRYIWSSQRYKLVQWKIDISGNLKVFQEETLENHPKSRHRECYFSVDNVLHYIAEPIWK